MGQVILGRDTLLERNVAVKFLVTRTPSEQALKRCHSPRYLIPNGTGQCDRSQTGQCDRPRLAQWDLELRNRPVIELTK